MMTLARENGQLRDVARRERDEARVELERTRADLQQARSVWNEALNSGDGNYRP